MISIRITRLATAALLTAGLGAAGLATATAQEAAPQPQQAQTPAATFDENKLRSFAVAYLEVTKIAQTYQPQFQAATNPEEQQRIQTEATNSMVQAVEGAEGITVEEYNAIASNAQSDPALAQQINTLVQESAGAEQ